MNPSTPTRARARARRLAGGLLISVLLAACGGGGDGPAPIPTVSSVSVVAGSAKYSQQMVISVTGTDVDQGLFVTSASCTDPSLSTSSPYASSSTTAYYRCKVSAVGDSRVTVGRASDLMVLGSAPFTVLLPEVSMTVTSRDPVNGGVNGAVNGTIVFSLAADRAPATVRDFLNYVNTGFYSGTIFHIVNSDAGVVQGGGYLPLTPGVTATLKTPNAPIALEVGTGLGNIQWSIGMARGPAANPATSQFYINVIDNPQLDGRLAVFGAVVTGTSVVTAMDNAPCVAVPNVSECAPNPNILIVDAVQTQ